MKISILIILLLYLIIYLVLSIPSIKYRTIAEIAPADCRLMYPVSKFSRGIIRRKDLISVFQGITVFGIIFRIMDFSSDNGAASRLLSRPVAYIICRLAEIAVPQSAAQVGNISDINDLMDLQSSYLDMVEKVTRKCAHVFEYACLAFSIWVLIYCLNKIRRRYSYLSGFLGVLIVGSIDEINQSSIEGRWGSPVDVCVDLIGAFLAMLLTTLVMKSLYKKYRKKYGQDINISHP